MTKTNKKYFTIVHQSTITDRYTLILNINSKNNNPPTKHKSWNKHIIDYEKLKKSQQTETLKSLYKTEDLKDGWK